jgi:hypothetical protein
VIWDCVLHWMGAGQGYKSRPILPKCHEFARVRTDKPAQILFTS